MKTSLLLMVIMVSGCGSVTYRNVKDPSRNLEEDRTMCQNTRASQLGVTHCLRQLGWDAQIGDHR